MKHQLTLTENERLAGLSTLGGFRAAALAYVAAVEAYCADQPFHGVVTFGRRDDTVQAGLWAKGRAQVDGVWRVVDEAAVVTWAPPGSSPHNYGLALDMPLLVDPGRDVDGHDHRGHRVTRRAGEWLPDDHGAWAELARIAQRCGLETGHAWPGRRDSAHCQHPRWRALAGLGG